MRPATVTAAYWCQVVTAGLLVVVVLAGVLAAVATPFAAIPGWTPWSVLLTVLAGWLTVTARGVRRGSRTAYRLSLAGLLLPPLAAVAASAFGAGTTEQSFGVFAYGDGAISLAVWLLLTTVVTSAAAVCALVLAVAAAALLLAGPSRRFFRAAG
jgi:hypothetical protein